MNSSVVRLIIIIVAAIFQLVSFPSAWCLETINLQLKWTHCFQFAGYYAAKEMGYYKEADLDVHFIEASPSVDPAHSVLKGDAQYGIGSSSILLQRAEKKPLVVLAVIFQHSPYILISSSRNDIHDIHNLAGKKIMLEPQSDELVAYLKKEGISINSIKYVEHNHGIQNFVDGKIDAMSGYTTYEPYFLNLINFPYQYFSPRSAGIDFYGDNLFTTEKEISDHPDRVRRFRAASLKGWRYALDHSDQIINLIISKYAPTQSIGFLQFEANQIIDLMHPELLEIGYMHEGRWKHILETYADLKMLSRDFSLEGFIYNPNPTPDRTILYLVIIALFIVIFIISLVTIRFINLNNKLRISEEQHRFLADNASDVIWTMDINGRYLYISPSVEKLRGYKQSEVMKQSLREILTPESAQIAEDQFKVLSYALENHLPLPKYRGELAHPCKDGSIVWTEVTVTPMMNFRNKFIGILGITRDINERRKMEEELKRLAITDPLTGAYNRRFFYEQGARELQRSARNKEPLVFALIDIDHFKSVNDNYGHDAGDEVLKALVITIKPLLRSIDLFCRLGGEEFAFLLINANVQEGTYVSERIKHSISELTICRDGKDIKFTVSIGIVSYNGEGESVEDAMKKADLALYKAKDSGRDKICIYDEQCI